MRISGTCWKYRCLIFQLTMILLRSLAFMEQSPLLCLARNRTKPICKAMTLWTQNAGNIMVTYILQFPMKNVIKFTVDNFQHFNSFFSRHNFFFGNLLYRPRQVVQRRLCSAPFDDVEGSTEQLSSFALRNLRVMWFDLRRWLGELLGRVDDCEDCKCRKSKEIRFWQLRYAYGVFFWWFVVGIDLHDSFALRFPATGPLAPWNAVLLARDSVEMEDDHDYDPSTRNQGLTRNHAKSMKPSKEEEHILRTSSGTWLARLTWF